MRAPMRFLRVIFVVCGALFATSLAFGQTQDLPSAPSSAVAPAPKKADSQATQTAPAQTAPAQSTAGQPLTLQSLEDHKKPQPKKDSPAPAESKDVQSLTPPADPNSASDKPQTGQAGTNPDFTVTKKVDEVNVIFTVTDKHGKFIKDLKQDEFQVVDDKRPAAAIRGFAAETNLPLRVGLLVDASNSIRDRFKFEQQPAIEVLTQI